MVFLCAGRQGITNYTVYRYYCIRHLASGRWQRDSFRFGLFRLKSRSMVMVSQACVALVAALILYFLEPSSQDCLLLRTRR